MPDLVADRERIEDLISDEIVRVQEDSYGAGSAATTTHFNEDVVLTILDVEVTTAERALLNDGQFEAVRVTREAFQEAIAPTFVAIVERATGRRVSSFVSHMNIEPLYSVELFRLKPGTAPV